MTTLLLKWEFDPCDLPIHALPVYPGFFFHRWLPDGVHDAIVLPSRDKNAKLKVWLERIGYVDGKFVEYDRKRREVDPETMSQQGLLSVGPLFGLLEITDISEEQATALRDDKIGSEPYVSLGKRVVKRLMGPCLSQFMNLVRVGYGQYWLRQFDLWDSRRYTLGAYCRTLFLRWSLDGGASWKDFIPDQPVVGIEGGMIAGAEKRFREYLTEKDWRDVEDMLQRGYEPPPAAIVAIRAQRLLNQGDLRFALVEGIVALELALNALYREQLAGQDRLEAALGSFWQLPLRTQLVAVASAIRLPSVGDISGAIEAIEARHRVVHEGWDPTERKEMKEIQQHLSALLRTVSALLPAPKMRFPSAALGGNWSRSSEEWEKIYAD